MKNFNKVYFIKLDGEKTYIGADYNKKLTLLNRDEAILASATTATPVYVETKEDLTNFYNIYRKPRKNHTLRNAGLTAAGLALVLGLSGAYALNSPETANLLNSFNTPKAAVESTQIINKDQASETKLENNEIDKEKTSEAETKTFDSVLAQSTSEKQKQVLSMMANYIRYFNGDFANTYKETVELTDENGNKTGEKIEVKPALSWEYEVPALTIAYNGYSAQKLHSIFNGKDLDADVLDKDYKVATLQLFGAYAISDRSMPVNLANLIESEEGKAFVQKYEDMFYSIKEAKTEEEKIQLVNAFYAELYNDFPIEEVAKIDWSDNEVGIAHSDSITMFKGEQLQPYKLAITPMITAMETMYQNLAIDYTMSDEVIDYFNKLGECNLAYKEFVKAQTASECGEFDDTLADYEELSRLLIKELKQNNAYVIDDRHRELTYLTRFQEAVNGHFNIVDGYMDGSWWYITDTNTEVTVTYSDPVVRTETHTTYKKETKTWETDDREEAVRHVGEDAVRRAEEKVDQQIERENEEARREANREADREQRRQQKIEDEKREELEDEVKHEDEQFAQDIEEANEQIEMNNDEDPTNDKPVNERDFTGHEVDFDEEHSNKNGDLDDSVKDITTDGKHADEALPDPNVTGEDFDERTDTTKKEEHHEDTTAGGQVEEYHEDTSTTVEEHHEEAAPVQAEEHHEEAPKEEHHEEAAPKEEHHEQAAPAEEHHEEAAPKEEHHEQAAPKEEHHEEAAPKEEHHEQAAPKEEHHEEAPKEEHHEEAPKEEHHEESHNDAPADTVNFEADDNDQYEEYTTTGKASDEELVDNYIAKLETATPEELAAIKLM